MENDTVHRHRVMTWAAIGAAAVLVTACDGSRQFGPSATSTTGSSAPSTPTPPFSSPTYRYASGIVTDDLGAAISGAIVEVVYALTPPGLSQGSPAQGMRGTTTTNAGGYGLGFHASAPLAMAGLSGLPSVAGLMHAWSPGFEPNAQFMPWETQSEVINPRLRRTRPVTAGQPITVSIEPDSSICWDQEDWFVPSHRCEVFTVVVDQSGTLTIAADFTEAGGSIPLVFSATSGAYRGQVQGPGTVSLFQAQAGQSYRIFAGLPDGTSQRIVLSTSLQP